VVRCYIGPRKLALGGMFLSEASSCLMTAHYQVDYQLLQVSGGEAGESQSEL